MKKSELFSKETLRYVLAGTLSAAVNLSVFFLMKNLLNVNYLISNLTAWTFTVIVSYFCDKIFVFRTPFGRIKQILKEFFHFVFGRVFSCITDMILLWILVEFFKMNSGFAKILNSGVVVVINYFVCKLLVFKA